jgi:hypothetical protein
MNWLDGVCFGKKPRWRSICQDKRASEHEDLTGEGRADLEPLVQEDGIDTLSLHDLHETVADPISDRSKTLRAQDLKGLILEGRRSGLRMGATVVDAENDRWGDGGQLLWDDSFHIIHDPRHEDVLRARVKVAEEKEIFDGTVGELMMSEGSQESAADGKTDS